jgi:putative phosphoesterase
VKILIASDLHGSVTAFQTILDREQFFDMALLLGDYLYHGPRNPLPQGYNPMELVNVINSLDDAVLVKGNVDADIDQELIKWPMSPVVHVVLPDDVHILAHHGDKPLMVKFYKAQAVLSGHTHIKVLEYDDEGVLRINPGSPSLPKDNVPSYAVLDGLHVMLKSLDGSVLAEQDILS